MSSPSYAHVYLSPHLDDAVLSCGGSIHRQALRGDRVLVVCFFAGSPADDSLTRFARELKERWGAEGDPLAARRAEDLAALRILGADGLHLGFLDCVYRQSELGEVLYPTEEHIFGLVHPAEVRLHRELLSAFVARVEDLAGPTLYAPLAAGHHVDHILVRRAAFSLLGQGRRVLFYPDYPYASDPQAIDAALQSWPAGCWSRESVRFGEEALRTKADAVACYASQISTFWAGPQEMRRALRAQALGAGEHTYAEDYWRISPDCLSQSPAQRS